MRVLNVIQNVTTELIPNKAEDIFQNLMLGKRSTHTQAMNNTSTNNSEPASSAR